jgi:hypothetical protein
VGSLKDILKFNKGDVFYAPIKVVKVKREIPTSVVINEREYVLKPSGQKRRK